MSPEPKSMDHFQEPPPKDPVRQIQEDASDILSESDRR